MPKLGRGFRVWVSITNPSYRAMMIAIRLIACTGEDARATLCALSLCMHPKSNPARGSQALTLGKMPSKNCARLGSCSRLLSAMRPMISDRSWNRVLRKMRDDDVVASSVSVTYCVCTGDQASSRHRKEFHFPG